MCVKRYPPGGGGGWLGIVEWPFFDMCQLSLNPKIFVLGFAVPWRANYENCPTLNPARQMTLSSSTTTIAGKLNKVTNYGTLSMTR